VKIPPKFRKWLPWAAGCLLLVVGLQWFLAPSIVAHEIRKRHPDVQFGSIDVDFWWREATLHKVNVNRGWLDATADIVRVNLRTEAVHAENGLVTLDVNKKPKGSSEGKRRNITAEGFSVHAVWGKLTADVQGVSLNNDGIHASSALLQHPDLQIMAFQGKETLVGIDIDRDFTHVTLSKVEFPEGVELAGQKVTPTVEKVSATRKDDAWSGTIGRVAVTTTIHDTPVAIEAKGLTATERGDMLHVQLDQAIVSHPWLSTEAVSFRNIETDVGRTLLHVFDVKVNGATLSFDRSLMEVSGSEPCQTWADALPDGLRHGPLAEKNLFSGQLEFSFALNPKPTVKISGACAANCSGPAVTALRHQFSYTAYDEAGKPFSRTTGPDMKDWVLLKDINERMPIAVMEMEDLGFRNHHGFLPSAIENSFVEDVKSGTFSRGGSTITMQLAKNVWLKRDKTIGRKVEELLLSQVLESCLTKDEIIETYLNVVEFGPDVYGVGPAAQHYFKMPASDLSAAQTFYLAWILPRPRKAPPPDEKTMAHMTALVHSLAAWEDDE
jgi:hypothetical protein